MRENLLSPALHDYADNRYRDRKASLGGLTIPADTLIGRLDGDRRALMHLLVGTLPIVFGRQFHRVAGIAQVLEMHALDHASGIDIQAGDDSYGQ